MVDVNKTYDLLELIKSVTVVKKTSCNWYSSPCPFCGGTDRFVLKLTNDGWRWLCRKCGDGKYHTPIDYIMKRDNVKFREAVETLGGEVIRNHVKILPEPEAFTLPDIAWQTESTKEVKRANKMLMENPNAVSTLGQAYLENRGIKPFAWRAWNLGYEEINNRQAIVIPNITKEQIISVKYRFIDAIDKHERFRMRVGSVPGVFGTEILNSMFSKTLLVVEGEMNAISAWQCLPPGVDVVSTGSDTPNPHILEELLGISRRYESTVVWFDEKKNCETIGELLNTKNIHKTPVVMGVKFDANVMLQKGTLVYYLLDILKERL